MHARLQQLQKFLHEDLWHYESAAGEPRAPSYIVFLRVLSLAWEGLRQNQLFNRAAALSYSSLIALGPLVGIMVMASGAYFQGDTETQIKRALLFVAPSLREYVTLEAENGQAVEGEAPPASELDLLIDQIIEGSEATLGQINTGGGGIIGFVGVFILIFIAIQLLTSVEQTFNSIWGVVRGRNISQRIVFYWSFITLGVLLGLGSTALLSASTATSLFGWLPFGGTLTASFIALTPFLAFLMLALLLTFCYQFFPNTTVRFRPALIGAAFVAILLFANNYFSILYVNQVIRMQSLYGSVGIILVLMVGLYFFWIFMLFGAQLVYAIQNVDFLTHREVWRQISVRAQETVTLAAWLLIARRFADCAEPPTASDISSELKVPGNVVNTSLTLLSDNRWITAIRQADEDGLEQTYYRPARPLSKYTLGNYRSVFLNHGNSRGAEFVRSTDPLLDLYRDIQKTPEGSEAFVPLETLLAKYPADAARAPEPRS